MINGEPKDIEYIYESYDYYNNSTINGVFPDPSNIAFPSFATSTQPNVFSVFYQTIADDDVGDKYDNFGGVESDWFGNIRYQTTKDGGISWGEAKAFRVNDPELPMEERIDYRTPIAAWNNNSVGGEVKYNVLFSADSVPGRFTNNTQTGQQSGYAYTSWWYQGLSFSAVKNEHKDLSGVSMGQCYPNPVSSTKTTIPVRLESDKVVSVKLTDMLGREISTIYSGHLTAGEHQLSVSTSTLPVGIYSYTLTTSDGSITQLLTVVR
jgi:hypothetical protein